MADDIAGLPQDLVAGMQDLQTRRAMALALLQQNLQDQGTQMAGQVAIRQSPIALLGRGLNIMGARDDIAGLPAQQQALLDAHQQRLADATALLIGAGQPTAGTPTTITEGAGPPTAGGDKSLMVQPGTPASLGDPQMLGKALAAYGAVGGNPQLSSNILQRRMALELAQATNPGQPGAAQFSTAPLPSDPGSQTVGAGQITIPPAPLIGGGQGGQGGGGIFGVNMPAQLQTMLLAGVPGAKEAATYAGEMNKPVKLGPGQVVFDPATNQPRYAAPGEMGQLIFQNGQPVGYKAVPGYAENVAAVAGAKSGAEAAAKQPFTTMDIDMGPQGGKITVPSDQGLAILRAGLGKLLGTAPGGAASPAPAGAPAPVPGPAGAPASAAIAVPNPATATTAAPGMAGPQGTTDTKPYYGTFPAVPQPTISLGQSPSDAQKAFNKTTGDDWAGQSNDVSVKGRDAANAIQRANEIKQLSANFTPGKITPILADTAAWLDSVGVPKSIVNGVGQGDLASYQTLSQLLTQNSLGSVKEALPGQRIGQQEVMLTAAKSPNPSMTKAAIDASMDYNIGNARWQVAKMAARDDWMARPGATYNGFENFWAQNNPPAKFMPSEAQVNATLGVKGAPQAATGAAGAARTAQAAPAPGPLRAVDAKGNMIELVNGAWTPVRAVSGNW